MEDIDAWLRNFITEFRKECKELCRKLSEEERSRIFSLNDFFPPCQILLLWLRDANLQYLICTHDDSRNDMEIVIKGPIPTYEAVNTMDSILKDPEWDRELSEEEKKYVYDKTVTFSEILEDRFLSIIRQLRDQPFRKPPPTSRVPRETIIVARDFSWEIEGSIAEINKTKMVSQILEEAKKEAAGTSAKPAAPSPPRPLINSCATIFYPPIWVGKLPRKTFKEKVRGSFAFPKKALNLEYKDRIVVINHNGLIAIGEENIAKATRMLNEIMATSLLMAFPASAVRELEVCESKINSSSLTITSWGTRTYTLRTQFSSLFPQQQPLLETRIEIEKETLIRVIKQAERISEDPDISDFLTFFLQAHTHLENSEYSQSFIMSWVIVERQMYWLWNKFLREEQLSSSRIKKLTFPAIWTIDFVLEALNLGGQLSKEDHRDLMALKSKRNDIIHHGGSTNFEEAEKCFKIARDIVKQRSGLGQA